MARIIAKIRHMHYTNQSPLKFIYVALAYPYLTFVAISDIYEVA